GDLGPNLVAGFDFISDPANAADGDGIDTNPSDPGDQIAGPRSSSWHGTHVAGTVAAVTNNNLGMAGVAWDARVMPLRVLGRRGGSSFDILEAVKFAAGLPNVSGQVQARRADIINLSLGGGGFSQAAADVYARVAAEGVIVIAAAGNENSSVSQYPASYANVVSVSAVDFQGNRAPYSSFGVNVDIAAPGGDIRSDRNNDGYADGVLSATVDESTGTPRASLKFENGTSMAAPHVAGIAALMKAVNAQLNHQSFENLLITGALTDEAGPAGRDDTYGYGIVNALKAVQAASNLGTGGGTPPPSVPIVSASPTELVFDSGSSTIVTVRNESTVATSLTSVTSDVPWASVEAAAVDGSGLGQYRVNLDRTNLGAGTYVGRVTFNFAGASAVVVGVSATVGAVSAAGELGPHYVLLLNPETGETVAEVAAPVASGVIPFQLAGVAAGNYYVVAGTDVDNDGFICEDGEACGAYPTINDVELVTVGGASITGLGFTSDIQSPLTQFGQIQSATAAPEAQLDFSAGFALMPKGDEQ
ncbi:MAG: S8 family serine peptidase, partial [Pseudomonadota bacterium]